jgi:hypothetical protein
MSAVTGNETDAEKIFRLQGQIHTLTNQLRDSEANCNRIIASLQGGSQLLDRIKELETQLASSDELFRAGRVQNNESGDELIQEQIKVANLEAELTNAQRAVKGYQAECQEVEQALGQALGYPWYRDDEKNFPNATDADGVCIGEHVPSSIALEAGRTITELKAKVKTLEDTMITHEAYDNLQSRLDEALESQISLFDMDYPPRASQGAPRHEVEDLLTADTVNFWIRRIQELTNSNAELQQMLDNRNVEINTFSNVKEGLRDTAAETMRQSTWRAERIGQLEGLLSWGLRKIIMSNQTPIRGHDQARASNLYRHIFPTHREISHRDYFNDTQEYARPIAESARGARININAAGRLRRAPAPTPTDAADAMRYAVTSGAIMDIGPGTGEAMQANPVGGRGLR